MGVEGSGIRVQDNSGIRVQENTGIRVQDLGRMPRSGVSVELIPTLGALFPQGGPVQDPVLTGFSVTPCLGGLLRV